MSRRSRDDVLAVLEQIVADDPGRLDQRIVGGAAPRYIHHGEPICLVAVALRRLGVSVASLRLLDREAHGRPTGLATSCHPAVGRLTREARELLDQCQKLQDSGHTWSSAVRLADRRTRPRR